MKKQTNIKNWVVLLPFAVLFLLSAGTTIRIAQVSGLQSALDGKQASLGYTAENQANKATSFGTVNNTLYPTVQACSTYIAGLGYITGNQSITLSGDISGTGTTAITTAIGSGKVTNAMLAGSIDLTTKVTGTLPAGNGGTGNAFFSVSGPATSTKTFTFPNSNGTVTILDAVQTLTNKTIAYGSNTITGLPVEIGVAVSDETTAITTGTAKVTFRMPHAMTVTAVRANVNTVSSSGTPTVDINEGGVSILGTKLTIDASEKTSTTAASAATITDASLADDAEITIDIDVAGTNAKGLKVWIIGTR
jgi:hypothetical protein